MLLWEKWGAFFISKKLAKSKAKKSFSADSNLKRFRFGFVDVELVGYLIEYSGGNFVDDFIARLARSTTAHTWLHVENRQHQVLRLACLTHKPSKHTGELINHTGKLDYRWNEHMAYRLDRVLDL
jgi:hypothetical protein